MGLCTRNRRNRNSSFQLPSQWEIQSDRKIGDKRHNNWNAFWRKNHRNGFGCTKGIENKHTQRISTIQAVIELKAFNYPGHVFFANSKPIEHVKILLDGIANVNSDKDGSFKLMNLSPGRHTVQGEKAHFEFGQETVEANSRNVAALRLTPKR